MADDGGAVPPRHDSLFQELLWIHGIIRANLASISALIEQIENGAPDEEVHTRLAGLKNDSILWKLRVNCLQYCHLVHGHHHLEDVALFPALRQANPELHAAIDRLEADHRIVAALLDEIDAIARRLPGEPVRDALAGALDRLREHLYEHLDFEETSLEPALRSFRF